SVHAPDPPLLLPLSLHDALPIWSLLLPFSPLARSLTGRWPTSSPGSSLTTPPKSTFGRTSKRRLYGSTSTRQPTALRSSLSGSRSEEHTSELQSRFDLVYSLLLE